MLHIILMILKVLGIIVLVILGFILLTIFSVLFVPIRYRASGAGIEKLEGEAVVTWLFGLIRAKVSYADSSSAVSVHIFGISPVRVMKWRERRKEKRAKRETVHSEKAEVTREKIESMQKKEPEEDAGKDSIGEEKPPKKRHANPTRKVTDFIKRFGDVKQKVRRVVGGAVESIKNGKNFLADETTREALNLVSGISKRMIHQILPHRVSGYLRFGFEDPSYTGRLLGMMSWILPIYKTKFRVIPVFDEAVLDAQISLKGRLYGWMLMKAGWQIYRSKAVKATIKRVRDREA